LIFAILDGELKKLIDNIKEYHNKKPFRAFRNYKESCFHTAVELLLSSDLSSDLFISELRLIMDYQNNPYKYGFVIFICDKVSGSSIVIELKLFNLYNGMKGGGLWVIYLY